MSEFDIISQREEYKDISFTCMLAEQATNVEDKAAYCREALEQVLKLIYEKEGRKFPARATLLELIDNNMIHQFIDNAIIVDSIHYIRKLGMNATHNIHITKKQAKVAFDNLVFFVNFIVKKFEQPEQLKNVVLPRYMTEAQTRKIYIDSYLNEARWDVMKPTSKTMLVNGEAVDSGIIYPGKACCEIPVEGMDNVSGIGFCDYVLYGKDGKPLAIVEAKRTSEKASKGEKQVQIYGERMKEAYGYTPVLYYTNGYEIYIIDGIYPARKVVAFHTLEELEYMLWQRGRNDISDLHIDSSIAGRPYQTMAITSVCEHFNKKYRRSLLVMATGTGKTRVAIALVDVLLHNKWIKNVLFLADRTSLVSQAFRSFKKMLKDMSYCVLSDRSLANEPNARITFSTYNTMIGYIDAEDKEFTSGRFDLIIIDEAHRSVFNRYASIFEYFDSLLVGLTATPKDQLDASTYDLFQCESKEPDFVYSLEEAVKDKYLVYYKTDSKTTRLMQRGFQYGDLSKEDKEKIDSIFLEEDIEEDFKISAKTMFKLVFNKDTCAKVLEDVMTRGLKVDYGQKIGKTIIFAYNKRHAEMIVKTFKANYPYYGNDYCQLIDHDVKGADKLIENFGENEDFRIAVSVDMLDTGIDVPSVLNLVFFKPVKSKIKFVQMIGRGTRLCERLIDGKDKEYFVIFDYCGNFEFFDINPDGVIFSNGKSLSQRLFDLRLDILVELQRYEYQNDPVCKAYYEKLKPQLFEKIQEVKQSSSRISVRQEMSYVDKYIDYENWNAISPLAKKEIQLHLTKLVNNDLNQKKESLQFDMQVLHIELSILATGNIGKASRQVESVRQIAKQLLTYAAAQPSVREKAEALHALVSNEFWTSPGMDKLEQYREDIRELLKYLPEGAKPVNINLEDAIIEGSYTGNSLIDIRTYKEKVMDYLKEHTDNETIRKIKNLDKIDENDLKELERILWHELGTVEEYHKSTGIANLAAFIRSIVGIKQEVINEKFGEFLNENVLNAAQQEFVKEIIDYVRANGDIVMDDLIEKSPFDRYDILSLFGENIVVVRKLVMQIHNSVAVGEL